MKFRHWIVALGTTCFIVSNIDALAQSATAAKPTNVVDPLDSFRYQKSSEDINRIQSHIAELQKHVDLGTDIIAKWKASASDFDQYRIAAEAQVNDCRQQKDYFEKLKREGLNEDTKQRQQRVVQICEERVREESVNIAKFEKILDDAEHTIAEVKERIDAIGVEVGGDSRHLELELAKQKARGGLEIVSRAANYLNETRH